MNRGLLAIVLFSLFSKIKNGNINIAGIGADKDYIKFGEYFQVWTLLFCIII